MIKMISIAVLLCGFTQVSFAQDGSVRATEQLFQAVAANDLGKAKDALNHGADILGLDANENTPADIAINKGYFDLAHFLLDLADQVKKNPPQPISTPAAAPDETAFAKTLPAPQSAVSDNPTKRLFEAVWDNNLAQVRASLDQGANLLSTNQIGQTPTDVAIDRGFFDLANELMQRTRTLKQVQTTQAPPPPPKPIASAPPLQAPPPKPQVVEIDSKIFMTDNDPFAPQLPPKSNLSPSAFHTKVAAMVEPVVEEMPDPVVEAKPAPIVKPKLEPVVEVKSDPVVEAEPGPIVVARLEPVIKPQLEPVVEPLPTPVAEPIYIAPFKDAPLTDTTSVHTKPRAIAIPHQDLNGALNVSLGKAPPEQSPDQPAPCMTKGKIVTVCIEPSPWSDDVLKHFDDLNVSIYKRFGVGNRAVVGYRKNKSSFVKTIFPATDFDAVTELFFSRFGTPDHYENQIVAPLGKSRQVNLVQSWYGYDAQSGRETVLQISHYDVTQGRFTTLLEGAIVYKYVDEPSVFKYINSVELVRLP
jgi:hypothetical protein